MPPTTASDALATAMEHARVTASAEAWALIAIALHITGTTATVDASGNYHVEPVQNPAMQWKPPPFPWAT